MVEMALGRLNRDLEEFEKELGIERVKDEIPVALSAPVPAVAARVSAPTLDKATIQRLGLEKKPINSNLLLHKLLDTPSLSPISIQLRSPTHFHLCRLGTTQKSHSHTTFTQHLPMNPCQNHILRQFHKTYTLSDEDALSTEIFSIPSSQVIALNKSSVYTREDVVNAVYSYTTSFYLATDSMPKNNFVMLHFRDDGDEHGVTHEKAVPVWLVMRVPGK
jgi:hypothetical protein